MYGWIYTNTKCPRTTRTDGSDSSLSKSKSVGMQSRTAAAAATQLVRRLGFTSAVALVVSNMVGTGIFATSGFLAGDLGSPGLLIGIWVVGGLLALVGAICYSELAVNLQRSGGEYVYLTEAWGPAWGFINGWVSFFAVM